MKKRNDLRVTFRWRILVVGRFRSQMRRYVHLHRGSLGALFATWPANLALYFQKPLFFVVFVSIHLIFDYWLYEAVLHIQLRSFAAFLSSFRRHLLCPFFLFDVSLSVTCVEWQQPLSRSLLLRMISVDIGTGNRRVIDCAELQHDPFRNEKSRFWLVRLSCWIIMVCWRLSLDLFGGVSSHELFESTWNSGFLSKRPSFLYSFRVFRAF